MPAPSLDDIVKLLVSMFTTDELRALVRKIDEGVVHTLPEGRGTVAVAERVAEAVLHRGVVDALRERLLLERPGRAHDIEVLWGRSTDARRARMAEAVSEAIEERGGDPLKCFEAADGDDDDVLYDTFRAMTLSRSRASWLYIARMTADYVVNHGGKADSFFRRCAWLLERCDDVDVCLLVQLMRWTRGSSMGLDPARHYGILWSLDDRTNSLSAHPLLLGDHADTSVGGVVEGEHEGDAASTHLLLSESRLVSWRKQGRLAFRAADDTLIRLVELFTGPLPLDVIVRLRSVKTR